MLGQTQPTVAKSTLGWAGGYAAAVALALLIWQVSFFLLALTVSRNTGGGEGLAQVERLVRCAAGAGAIAGLLLRTIAARTLTLGHKSRVAAILLLVSGICGSYLLIPRVVYHEHF